MIFSDLKNFVTDFMAIDLGTASTIIAVKGRDIVLDEPSCVAVSESTGDIIEYGHEAYEMEGREGRDVDVVFPISAGVIGDYERAGKMLEHFVDLARSGGHQRLTNAVIGMQSDVTHVEQRALLDAASGAGLGRVFLVEEGLAAALGAGISPEDKKAAFIVDIGAGTTNVAVVAKGTIVHATAERFGSADINQALVTHLRGNHGLLVGAESIEHLKISLADSYLPDDLGKSMIVRGRDLKTGRPGSVEVSAGELYPVVDGIVRKVAQLVGDVLTELQPQVAADVSERGILVTGGGAQLKGLDRLFRDFIDLPVTVADEPRYATVRGLLRLFDEPELLERVARNEFSIIEGGEEPTDI